MNRSRTWVAVAAASALGAVAGVALERRLMRREFPMAWDDIDVPGQFRGAANRVPSDGVGLHVEIDEPETPLSDITVVFTHGYALNLDCWHFQREHLRGRYRLVLWDQRSHGRSGRGPELSHTIDQLGRDLATVIDTCVPHGPMVLVGHSMGGMTIMALADQHPEWFGERILGAALLATSSGHMSRVPLRLPRPAVGVVRRHSPELVAAILRWREYVELGRARSSDLTYVITKLYSFGAPTSPVQAQFVADMVASTPVDVLADFLPGFDEHDKAAALAALQQVDCLVMVGDADVLTPVDHSDEIVRRVPGADYVLASSTGHMIITERADLVNAHLDQLLERVGHRMHE